MKWRGRLWLLGGLASCGATVDKNVDPDAGGTSSDSGAGGGSHLGGKNTSGSSDGANGPGPMAGKTGGGAGGTTPAPEGGSGPRSDGGAGPDPQGGAGPSPNGGAGPDPQGGAGGDPEGGSGSVDPTTGSYSYTGTWPEQPMAIVAQPGTLTYTKVALHDRFLAESCSIADFNRDGVPDVSAGRRWYEGPFGAGGPLKEHIFRGGHDDLPRSGVPAELVTGVADGYACYAYDVDDDGWTDIINIASPDVDETQTPSPAPAPQPHATAFWYKNPGGAGVTGMWTAHPMHADVRHEQHGLVDVNSDGKPEIYGACSGCSPAQTLGFYQANWDNPTAPWTYRAVTHQVEFPFGGTGWMHGLGFGDVNKDGAPDLLERLGIWTDALAASPSLGGFVPVQLYGGGAGGQLGGSHMFAADLDGDGDSDIVSADYAHNYGLTWYEQTTPLTFVAHKIFGTAAEAAQYGGIAFSQPHAVQVADMDADGDADIVTGKMRFAHPAGYGDPDLEGDPVSYVFKNVRSGGSSTFQAFPIDTSVSKAGVGRQIAVGHVNSDGIMDVCTANKLGLYVYLGQ